jgi:tetratricopeptide (TPR) repeat protein
MLDAEDALGAQRIFRRILAVTSQDRTALIGMGRTYLLQGRAELARRYADAALRQDFDDQAAQALRVRALLRARRFSEARRYSEQILKLMADGQKTQPNADLLAAHASALFRVQQNDAAAEVYQRVLSIDPLNEEAHLRLGSGLTPPREVLPGSSMRRAVFVARRGRHAEAIAALELCLEEDPGNPIAHRLLGENLFSLRAASSMAGSAEEFRRLQQTLPTPSLGKLPVDEFMPQFDDLRGQRRRIAIRALVLFGSRLSGIVAMGGRHDLLLEDQRTTDAKSRASLRGKRTFDGRVWDDVRGIGGLRAATGIEALDEAAQHGFDTLAHEIGHQVHLYSFTRKQRREVRELYKQAMDDGLCLDYYAASNDAEYFGQGVEAFVSLGKRPTPEATHGHTRFELMRVDPDLHDFIASLVDHDPLRGVKSSARPEQLKILRAAVAVALRCGRPEDALTAATLMPPGAERDRLLRQAARALKYSHSL